MSVNAFGIEESSVEMVGSASTVGCGCNELNGEWIAARVSAVMETMYAESEPGLVSFQWSSESESVFWQFVSSNWSFEQLLSMSESEIDHVNAVVSAPFSNDSPVVRLKNAWLHRCGGSVVMGVIDSVRAMKAAA